MAPQSEADAFWYLPPHLSAAQHAAMDALRARLVAANALAPSLGDDLSLLRFLKARNWDVNKAAVMYQVRALLDIRCQRPSLVHEFLASWRRRQRLCAGTVAPLGVRWRA